jgi:hypothetical protein
MTLQSQVSRVDDYTEELSRNLEKLAMEKAGGTINKDEQMDFILELRKALYKKDVKPWMSHARSSCVLGITLLIGTRLLPSTVPHHELILIIAIVVACLALAFAVFSLILSIQRNRKHKRWVNKLEDTVNEGGTVFDLDV